MRVTGFTFGIHLDRHRSILGLIPMAEPEPRPENRGNGAFRLPFPLFLGSKFHNFNEINLKGDDGIITTEFIIIKGIEARQNNRKAFSFIDKSQQFSVGNQLCLRLKRIWKG